MRKKVITRLCEKPWSGNVRVLDLGIQKLSTKILGCLPSPHSTFIRLNMIKVNRYDNRGKISRTSQKICESKK